MPQILCTLFWHMWSERLRLHVAEQCGQRLLWHMWSEQLRQHVPEQCGESVLWYMLAERTGLVHMGRNIWWEWSLAERKKRACTWVANCQWKWIVVFVLHRGFVGRESKRESVYMCDGLSVKVDCRFRAAPGFCVYSSGYQYSVWNDAFGEPTRFCDKLACVQW